MDLFGAQDTILGYKMRLNAVFDKTAFVKLKIRNSFKQNIDETHSKRPKMKIYTSQWISKISRKKSGNQKPPARPLPNVSDFQKENHTLGYGKSIEHL
jgi:hypothetical protein